jgi:hypothetical protein
MKNFSRQMIQYQVSYKQNLSTCGPRNDFRHKFLPAFHTAIIKVKVKFALEQTMNAQTGNRGIALLFL